MTTVPVTAVIPAWNSSAYIAEALDSVMAQTARPEQIIVVDDASSDGTADRVAARYPAVELVRHTRNTGPAVSRQEGVERARHAWVAFLDADDVWMPGHLATMVALLDRHPEAALAFGAIRLFGARDGIWPERLAGTGRVRDFLAEQLQGGVIQTSTMVFRRTCFQAVDGFREIERFENGRRIQAEDYDLTLRLAYRFPFVAAPEPTVRYRIHPGQSSVQKTAQIINNFEYRMRFLRELPSAERADPRVREGIRGMTARWTDILESRWEVRQAADLRCLVGFGLGQYWLRGPTWRYLPRALAAGWLKHAT